MKFKPQRRIEARKLSVSLPQSYWDRLDAARRILDGLGLEDDLDVRLTHVIERWVEAVEAFSATKEK